MLPGSGQRTGQRVWTTSLTEDDSHHLFQLERAQNFKLLRREFQNLFRDTL